MQRKKSQEEGITLLYSIRGIREKISLFTEKQKFTLFSNIIWVVWKSVIRVHTHTRKLYSRQWIKLRGSMVPLDGTRGRNLCLIGFEEGYVAELCGRQPMT